MFDIIYIIYHLLVLSIMNFVCVPSFILEKCSHFIRGQKIFFHNVKFSTSFQNILFAFNFPY